MENRYDYKKFAILYVDDNKDALEAFDLDFGNDFRLITATSAREGIKLLEQHADEIGLLLTDQRMPGETGVWLLERARQLQPNIPRILVTGFTDYADAIAAVNTGAIYKYVNKPWNQAELELILRQALEFFMVRTERDQLLHEKLSVRRNMMIAARMVSLGLLAAGLKHHTNNSMQAVQTFLDMAPTKMANEKEGDADSLRDPGFWQEYHQKAQNQIRKMNELIGGLRTASEKPSGNPFTDEIHLKPAVASCADAMRAAFAAKRIEVDNQIPDLLPPLRVDQPQFDRLIELLLQDELAMLPAGCRITFSAELQGSEIVFYLVDNGPAIPQEALSIALDPMVVTSGTASEYGINLMCCFFIVHHHGGKIEAQNLSGGGNRFTIRLPLKPEPAVAAHNDTEFLQKALLNDGLWEKLLAGR